MMRSLFAGVSGLKNHQTRMDVIGNNIANVNTVGYKKSRVTFQDMLSQLIRGAASPTTTRGGTNPMQVGLGMTLASIDVIHTPGSPQSTGKNTDLSIEGEGYFLVGEGDNIFYTRAGNFDFDYNKTLVNTSNGMVVKGILADGAGYIDPQGDIVDINLASQVSAPPRATTEAVFSKNLDSRVSALPDTEAGVAHVSGGGDTLVTLGAATLPVTRVSIAGLTEGTHYNVNYTTGQVTILSATANGPYDIDYWIPDYQTNINVFDSEGAAHQLTVSLSKTGVNTWSYLISKDPSDTSLTITAGSMGTIAFNTDGSYNAAGSTIPTLAATVTGADNLSIDPVFSSLSQYAGETTVTPFSQNGYPAGDLQAISVDTTGTVTGSFSNGQTRKLAQIAIATFANPAGLVKMGNNLFQVSNNSGTPATGIPGTGGRGLIKPETLEMSNVDLSQEFVDMIITQRGFQANSRVITTSDQILEELVNLRR